MIEDRVISPEYIENEEEEQKEEFTLRPKVFDEYIGQKKVKENGIMKSGGTRILPFLSCGKMVQ